MTERTVAVRLKAITGAYDAAMARSGQSTKALAKGLKDAATDGSRGLQQVKGEATAAGASLLGIGVAVGVATINFDKQMSAVRAATKATGSQFERLREQAIQLGADTSFSASEAAQGQEELAKAGLSTADILSGALAGSLDLAAAGAISVADASAIAATTMVQFGLKGRDVTHIADVLAAAAGKAQGSVTDVGQAMKYVGPVAQQMGISLEETAGTVALLASNGILADQAGTSLRGMLASLTSPSGIAAKTMKDLGIQVYDATGQFIGFDGVAGQLKDRLGGLTAAQRDEALGRIFGNEQITAARVLYAGGAKAVEDWTRKVNDSGYASEQAGERLDNLAGDWEAFTGSVESGLITAGTGLNGFMRGFTQAATEAVNRVSALPSPVLAAGTAAAVAAGGFLVLAPRVADSVDAFRRLRDTSPRTATALGRVGKAAGVAAAALTAAQLASLAFGESFDDSAKGTETLVKELTELARTGKGSDPFGFEGHTGQAYALSDALAEASNPDFFSSADKWASDLAGFDSVLGNSQKLVDSYDKALAQMVSSGSIDDARAAFSRLRESFIASGKGNGEDFDKQFNDYADALDGVDNAASAAGGSTSTLAIATQAASDAATDAKEALETLDDALKLFRGEAQSVDAANASLQEAFDDAAEATDGLKKATQRNRTELNLSTAAGRKAQSALGAIADSLFHDVIPAYAKAGKPISDVERATQDARDAFIASAVQAGLNATAAEDLADAYGLIPKDVATTYAASGVAAAKAAAKEVEDAVRAIPKSWTVVVKVDRRSGTQGTGGGRVAYEDGTAGGGFVYGPGPSNRDSFLQPMANGEFVTRAAIAQAHPQAVRAVNDGRLGDAAAMFAAAAGRSASGGGFSIGEIYVTSAPEERAEESLPRALRREAFLLGIGEGQ